MSVKESWADVLLTVPPEHRQLCQFGCRLIDTATMAVEADQTGNATARRELYAAAAAYCQSVYRIVSQHTGMDFRQLYQASDGDWDAAIFLLGEELSDHATKYAIQAQEKN